MEDILLIIDLASILFYWHEDLFNPIRPTRESELAQIFIVHGKYLMLARLIEI